MRYLSLLLLLCLTACAGGGGGDDDAGDTGIIDPRDQIPVTARALAGLWCLDLDASDDIGHTLGSWAQQGRIVEECVTMRAFATSTGPLLQARMETDLGGPIMQNTRTVEDCGGDAWAFGATDCADDEVYEVTLSSDVMVLDDGHGFRVYDRM